MGGGERVREKGKRDKGQSGEEGRRERRGIKKAMYTNLRGLVLDCIYIIIQ